jgi:hypothetical protein
MSFPPLHFYKGELRPESSINPPLKITAEAGQGGVARFPSLEGFPSREGQGGGFGSGRISQKGILPR